MENSKYNQQSFFDDFTIEDTIKLPSKTIKLGTLFSGIGAIEQAFLKLGIKHEIVFACDNGEREINQSREEIENLLKDVPEEQREETIEKMYLSKGENFMETSYKANYNIANDRFFQDIRFLHGNKYEKDIDIIVGGSPCQAFSYTRQSCLRSFLYLPMLF